MNRREEAQRLGQMGERWVRRELERMGWRILAANWRCPCGELDIVAADGVYLLFVEVKTRRSGDFAAPREAVDWRKRQNLLRTAQHYLAEHPQESCQPRFDVAEVLMPHGTETRRPTMRYYPNAFQGDELCEDTGF